MRLMALPFTRAVACGVSIALTVSGCVAPVGHPGPGTDAPPLVVGPGLSSDLLREAAADAAGTAQVQTVPLDVVIPVFDPGLPAGTDQSAGYDPESGIWPELRRAEANRFAYQLKRALEETGAFGAVRVTPDAKASGDLYLMGRIADSDGEEVAFSLRAVDSSGRTWMDEVFEHTVHPGFHMSVRNEGADPYDPAFDTAAATVVELMRGKPAGDLEALRAISELRFASSFAEEAFAPHLRKTEGHYQLVSLPADEEPMLERIRAIRVRDQLFIDSLQAHYQDFNARMADSYLAWQAQSLETITAQRQAEKAAMGKAAGGVLLMGLAVLSAIAGGNSKVGGARSVGNAGMILGGVAGAKMLSDSFHTRAEAKMHREALAELGQSIDMEMGPQVIDFEKQTVKLTGDAREQFNQWRSFLARMYEAEATPDRQL